MTTQNTPLLNLFGLQKMQPGAEGETGQRFYNRDTFKDLSANLAMGLNSMRLNPDASLPQRMQAQIAQRGQSRTRNRTVEALRKKAEGGDKLAAKYLSAIESGALPVAQAMSAYMQEGAQLAAEGRAAARAAANRVTSRLMTAEEVAAAGLPPGGVYQRNSLGGVTVVSRAEAAKPPTLREFDGDLYRQEGNNLILQIEGKDDPTAPVFREFDGNLYRQEGNELVLVKEGTEKLKDPKNASLVTLISKTPVTINGKTYAANVPFSLNEATQQTQIDEATRQGAIEAPRVTQTLTNPENVPTVDEVLAAASENPDAPQIDIAVGAGGDLGGKAVDMGNAISGFFTGGSVSEEREKQVATINAANNSIKQPLVKALNKAGSNYTQKTIETILPTPNLTNEKFIQRAEALFPTLQAELSQQLVTAQSAKDPAARTSAKNQADAISAYIASMSAAIAVYRRSNSGSGGSLQDQADAILGGGN